MRNAWRRVAESTAVLAALIASPVWSQSGPVSPMILLPAHLLDLHDPGSMPGTPIADLPLVRFAPGSARAEGTSAWWRTRTHVRNTSAVADLYPVAGSGLRLSAGTRLHAGYAQVAVSPDTRTAMRNDPWRSRGPSSLGNGYQSYAPVAMVGYDRRLTERWRLGVDAGAMRGRMASIYPFDGSVGHGSGPGVDGADQVNPMMDLTVACAF